MAAIAPDDRLALTITAATCVAIVAALFSVGFNPLLPAYHLNNLLVYAAAWIFVLGTMYLIRLARVRPESPIRYLRDEFFDADRRRDALRALLYSAALATFGTLFSLAKRSIPLFADYGWDGTLIAFDHRIHGTDAWLLLQPVLGFPIVTWILGSLYHVWVLLIYLGNFYFIFFEKNAQLRSRYVVAYVLSWTLVGFVAAGALASVGPCFAEPILGIDRFAGQMAYLRSVDAQYPLMVLNVQDTLLKWYFDDAATLGAGIAAMPSMHVSQAFLFFLAMRHKSRHAGIVFGLFTFVILIASVHLAYHYAADGYVAIVVTAIIWRVTGALFQQLGKQRGSGGPGSVAGPVGSASPG